MAYQPIFMVFFYIDRLIDYYNISCGQFTLTPNLTLNMYHVIKGEYRLLKCKQGFLLDSLSLYSIIRQEKKLYGELK